MDLEAQGRDSTFTFFHAQLKKVQVAGLFWAALYMQYANDFWLVLKIPAKKDVEK